MNLNKYGPLIYGPLRQSRHHPYAHEETTRVELNETKDEHNRKSFSVERSHRFRRLLEVSSQARTVMLSTKGLGTNGGPHGVVARINTMEIFVHSPRRLLKRRKSQQSCTLGVTVLVHFRNYLHTEFTLWQLH